MASDSRVTSLPPLPKNDSAHERLKFFEKTLAFIRDACQGSRKLGQALDKAGLADSSCGIDEQTVLNFLKYSGTLPKGWDEMKLTLGSILRMCRRIG